MRGQRWERFGAVVVLGLAVLWLAACGSDGCGETVDVGAHDTTTVTGDVAPPEDLPMADTPPEEDVPPFEPPGLVRFVHISDLHVHGDAAAFTAGHLERAVELLAALDFPADFLVATGDFVDYLSDDLVPGDPSAYRVALDTLAGVPWPVEAVAGNHEYYKNDNTIPTDDRPARHALLAAEIGQPLDRAFVVSGVRFVALNSMAGDRWSSNAGLLGSYTDEQLTWLRGELADGRPTFLFFHHPPAQGVTTPAGDSLCGVFDDHPDVVKGVFAGHLHTFRQGELCGVPFYLVANVAPPAPFYYLVEYDGAADELTLVNEADLPTLEAPTLYCAPTDEGLPDATATEGTTQVLRVGSMVSNLPGLEAFEGDALDSAPPVLHVVEAETPEAESGATLRLRVTFGKNEDGFVVALPGFPCLEMEATLDGPCFVTDAVRVELDAVPLLEAFLEASIDPSWQVRLHIESLWFEGRWEARATGGVPEIAEGLLHLDGSGTQTIEDLKSVLVGEYCAGQIDGCEPGASDAFPTCPDPFDHTFLDSIPDACDVTVAGYPLRFLLLFASSYPLDNISMLGAFHAEARELSATPGAGLVDEQLFSTEPGGGCAP